MDLTRAMRAFVNVVRLGGFAQAARALQTTQPNVSKLIAALESELGGLLFERNTRPLTLTGRGERFHARANAILGALDDAKDEFEVEHQDASGVLRIAASVAFGRTQIVPSLPELLERHPRLEIDLRLSDQSIDLVRESIDIAFRVAKLADSDLVAKSIGEARRLTVASPAYLARFGTPAHPSDLATHQCIQFSGIGAPRQWSFSKNGEMITVPVRGRIGADASDAVREAAVQGLGVAVLPAWVLQQDLQAGRLCAVLEDFELPPIPVQAIMPRSAKDSARVRAALIHFEARFTQFK
jgi:DNA-binding transcriptional LysR family regulator